MKYYFIAGHGENDPGAVSHLDGRTYRERDLACTLVSRICQLTGAEHYTFEKDAYRHTEELAAAIPTDVTHVVEIHFNAFVNQTVRGTEVYLVDKTVDIPAKQLAESISTALETANRGVKYTAFKVISKLKALGLHACLLETAFVTSTYDMQHYDVDKAAYAIINALGLRVINSAPAPTAERWSDTYMERVKKLGIMTDGRPTDPVTREELAAVICRTLDVIGNG